MLTDLVRSSCRAVIAAATSVVIDTGGLNRLALVARGTVGDTGLPPVSFDEARAMRVLAGDAINFGSGYHDIVSKEPGLSGARTMQARLDRYIDATGSLDHRRLAAITPSDCSQIFGQELDGGALEELMTRFAIALNDLGGFVEAGGGSARAILTACGDSAVTLAKALAAMPYYDDVAKYGDADVAFFKRAQITPADLARQGLWSFADLDRLTAFADNLVPHVLRLDGALVLDSLLERRIDAGEHLEAGGAEEVELRAAAVVAVDELVVRIGRPGVWAMHVDAWLWERGSGARYKTVRRPRVRSVFY